MHTIAIVSKTRAIKQPTMENTKPISELSLTVDCLFFMAMRNVTTQNENKILKISIFAILSFKKTYPARSTNKGPKFIITEYSPIVKN